VLRGHQISGRLPPASRRRCRRASSLLSAADHARVPSGHPRQRQVHPTAPRRLRGVRATSPPSHIQHNSSKRNFLSFCFTPGCNDIIEFVVYQSPAKSDACWSITQIPWIDGNVVFMSISFWCEPSFSGQNSDLNYLTFGNLAKRLVSGARRWWTCCTTTGATSITLNP
jgi:hypothetical protein